jgi:hypothetical protein
MPADGAGAIAPAAVVAPKLDNSVLPVIKEALIPIVSRPSLYGAHHEFILYLFIQIFIHDEFFYFVQRGLTLAADEAVCPTAVIAILLLKGDFVPCHYPTTFMPFFVAQAANAASDSSRTPTWSKLWQVFQLAFPGF